MNTMVFSFSYLHPLLRVSVPDLLWRRGTNGDRRVRYAPRSACLLLTAAIFAATQVEPLEAQRLSGRLVDVESEDPVGAGLVTLLRGDSVPIITAVSDDNGEWTLEAQEPGFYFINVKRLGYHESLVGPLELAEDGELTGVFRLERLPLMLEPIEISAAAVDRRLDNVGFYRRQLANNGSFIERSQIEQRLGAVSDPAQLLRAVPGVNVVEGLGGGRLRFTRGHVSGSGCAGPRIYVDDVLFSEGDPLDPPLAVAVRADDIVAMEVYRSPSQIPAQYGGPMSGCGVLLIWTLAGGR